MSDGEGDSFEQHERFKRAIGDVISRVVQETDEQIKRYESPALTESEIKFLASVLFERRANLDAPTPKFKFVLEAWGESREEVLGSIEDSLTTMQTDLENKRMMIHSFFSDLDEQEEPLAELPGSGSLRGGRNWRASIDRRTES